MTTIERLLRDIARLKGTSYEAVRVAYLGDESSDHTEPASTAGAGQDNLEESCM